MKPIKAYVNILKLRLNLALRRTTLNNYPIFAVIEPTLFCNLRCPACPTGLRLGLRPANAIDQHMYESLIDEIGDYLFEMQMFNWGEPLLHKQTPALIKYAKMKKIKVSLSSNLSMKLSDEYIDALVTSGLDELIVSLDGATQEVYEKYRRGGDISLVRDNMLRIQKAKKTLRSVAPAVVWQFLVFRHNQHELEFVQRNYREWGADQACIWGGFTSVGTYDRRFYDDKSGISMLEKSDMPQYDNSLESSPFQKPKGKYSSDRPCPWLYGAFVLNPNGMVSPCCSIWDEKDDFAEYSPSIGFLDAWNSKRFVEARSLFLKPRKHWQLVSERFYVSNISDTNKIIYNHDNVGLNSSEKKASKNGLICNYCPTYGIPSALEIPNNSITNYFSKSAIYLLNTRKMKYLPDLLALLLVGGPYVWRFVASNLKLRILGYLHRSRIPRLSNS
jgi:MoaA/NifB/PqqE/SkfB family radical SAM enzyme